MLKAIYNLGVLNQKITDNLGILNEKIKKSRIERREMHNRLMPAKELAVKISKVHFNICKMDVLIPEKYLYSKKAINSLGLFYHKIKEILLAVESENIKTQDMILTLLKYPKLEAILNIPDLLDIFKSDFPLEEMKKKGFKPSDTLEYLRKSNNFEGFEDFEDFELIEFIYEKEGDKLEKGFKELIPQANSVIENTNKLIKEININANKKFDLIKTINIETI
jgi:hypothetical protein